MARVTVAVVVKVNEGLVFAADSATTVGSVDPDSSKFEIMKIYKNANKIFNLHKALPVGAMTWGLGNIGPASISSLAKDLRPRLTGDDPDWKEWTINPETYQIEEVAQRVREFIFEERYCSQVPASAGQAGVLGMLVGGYSAHSELPEAYFLQMEGADCTDPIPVHPKEESGVTWWGQQEPIMRLINGVSQALPTALRNLGVKSNETMAYTTRIIEEVRENFVQDGMPIQDAIDLADYLVDTTIKYARFAPGHATVGGPIEIAAITRHEGFKWIERKQYFPYELNR